MIVFFRGLDRSRKEGKGDYQMHEGVVWILLRLRWDRVEGGLLEDSHVKEIGRGNEEVTTGQGG